MNASFDVAVLGAGPAGAAAALAAARAGLSVGLFEPQAVPDKPCGEGILPSGVAALRQLELQDLLAQGHALERIRYVLASGRALDIELPPDGCALERPLLAAALARALAREPRVTLLPVSAASQRAARGFLVESGQERWAARTLIAADGLLGSGAAWLRAPPWWRASRQSARRYGLRARAEARLPLEHVEVHLGRTSEVYLTPLAGGRVNVAVLRDELPPGDRASAAWLAAALEEHPRAASVLGAWLTPPEARALSSRQPHRVSAAGAFLAGDATGGVDPVLGCGVAIALATGLAAARAAGRVLTHGSGAPERGYARFVAHETGLRRRFANALVFMARHPRLQEAVAMTIDAWPAASARLVHRIAGSAGVCDERPDARPRGVPQAAG